MFCQQVSLRQGEGCASCSLALWTHIWLGKKKMLFVYDSSHPVRDCLSFQYESHWSKHSLRDANQLFHPVLVKNKAGLLTHLPCISYLALDYINQGHSFSHNQRQSPLLKCTWLLQLWQLWFAAAVNYYFVKVQVSNSPICLTLGGFPLDIFIGSDFRFIYH